MRNATAEEEGGEEAVKEIGQREEEKAEEEKDRDDKWKGEGAGEGKDE